MTKRILRLAARGTAPAMHTNALEQEGLSRRIIRGRCHPLHSVPVSSLTAAGRGEGLHMCGPVRRSHIPPKKARAIPRDASSSLSTQVSVGTSKIMAAPPFTDGRGGRAARCADCAGVSADGTLLSPLSLSATATGPNFLQRPTRFLPRRWRQKGI